MNTAQVIQTLERDGCAVVPGFDTSGLAEDIALAEAHVAKDLPQAVARGMNRRVINEPYNQTLQCRAPGPAMQRFADTPWFAEVIEACMGPAVYPNQLYAVRSQGPTDGDAFPYFWHMDAPRFLKFFVYVDITDSEGAFEFAPGSHIENRATREAEAAAGMSWRRIARRRPDPASYVRIEGGPGTLIVIDTDTTHRAGPLYEGQSRLIFQSTAVSHEGFAWRAYDKGESLHVS